MARPDKAHLRRTFLWQAFGLVAALLPQACKVDSNARVLTVRSALTPSSDCGFVTSNPTIAEGYYDPWVNSGGGAQFGFAVENYSLATSDEVLALSPIVNIDTHRHDAQIEAVEGCFFLANGLTPQEYALRPDGSVIDCNSLPAAQSKLQLVSNTVDEGKGLTMVSLRALDLTDLRQLFGTSFDPTNIPTLGETLSTDVSYNPNLAGLPQTTAATYAYSYAPEDPSNPSTRGVSWGEKYPADRQALVILQMRVRAKMLSGGIQRSNWFTLPITVCPGCLRDACGPLVQKVCGRGPCTDGTPCMKDGTCAAGSPVYCTPISVFSGQLPNYAVTGACLPAQNYPGAVGPTCESVGCDAT